MESLFPDEMLQRMEQSGIVAVLTIDEPNDIVPVAKALTACGINVVELTLRTPAAIEALSLLRREVPDILVGAGTVLRPDQVAQVKQAGAQFGVAPGLNPRVVREAQQAGLPFAPGIVTPSDIEAAIELGCRELKFFPAEPSGGVSYLRTLAAPYQHLGLRFLPLGGINASNLPGYVYDPAVLAVGGSWLAPRSAIQQRDWSTVIDLATEARRTIKEFKKA